MNQNVLQKAKEFDYAFVSRLLLDIFDKSTLISNEQLDISKIEFIQGMENYVQLLFVSLLILNYV